MHTVFEDEPKRDWRLWLGDLRLHAFANYETFGNNGLVKRCLYLFSGMTLADGGVPACVFEQPDPHADDLILFDYSLFFVTTLYDYYVATGDKEALQDLWAAAVKQLDIAWRRAGADGIVRDDSSWWCFVDWHLELNKQSVCLLMNPLRYVHRHLICITIC